MNADSVKARLKNFAVSSGCTFQDALVYYGLERTIYRLSVSPYASHFVLKGGIFLYAIFDRKYERATTDVDLLARRISNSAEEMKDVFRNIFAQDTDDALVFDLASITAEDITEFKEYHGLHISAVAYLDRTRIVKGFHDHTLLVDQVCGAHDPHADFSIVLFFLPDIIGLNHFLLRIGQKSKGKSVFYDCPLLAELGIQLAEGAGLLRTSRRHILGIKIKNHFLSPLIGEGLHFSVLIRKSKFRCFGSDFQHKFFPPDLLPLH